MPRWLDAQQGGAHRDPKPDVQLANFFEFEQPAEGYSVIYDYTYVFLIAPTLRMHLSLAYGMLTGSYARSRRPSAPTGRAR